MFPQLPFAFYNPIPIGLGIINATARRAGVFSPIIGAGQINSVSRYAAVLSPIIGAGDFDIVATSSAVETEGFAVLPPPTEYEAVLGFAVFMYINTTYITGIYHVVQETIWDDNQVYNPPSAVSSSTGLDEPFFTVTPDLSDVNIGGDIYVDTGDRYFGLAWTKYLDTVEPYWSLQLQYYVKARWSFNSTDHIDYDPARCTAANVKVVPTVGTTANQRRGFTDLVSTETNSLLPSTTYVLNVAGTASLFADDIIINYPAINTLPVDFGGGLRVLYLTSELDVTGANIDTSTYSPETITSPLSWYWTSPTTTNNYDL